MSKLFMQNKTVFGAMVRLKKIIEIKVIRQSVANSVPHFSTLNSIFRKMMLENTEFVVYMANLKITVQKITLLLLNTILKNSLCIICFIT